MSLIALRPPPAWRTRVPAPSRLRPVISAIAFVMVVRDKPVTVERRLMPPQPKSNALSATYQRCCASLRVDRDGSRSSTYGCGERSKATRYGTGSLSC